MFSPARMSVLPGGVRELAASSRLGSLSRTSALVSGKYGKSLEQRRGITIDKLDEGRGSTFFQFLPSSHEIVVFVTLTTLPSRPRARSYPRIRMGRLHSRPLSRRLEIPNPRCISPFLLRLHAPPGLYRRRHLGISHCPRTRAQPTNKSRILPRMGRRCGFQE